jgi:hypothetical protein
MISEARVAPAAPARIAREPPIRWIAATPARIALVRAALVLAARAIVPERAALAQAALVLVALAIAPERVALAQVPRAIALRQAPATAPRPAAGHAAAQ